MKGYFIDHYDPNLIRHLYSAEDLANIVKDSVEYYEEHAKKADERANRTEEEIRADIQNEFKKENQQLKRELHLSFGHFNSESELNKFTEFNNKHSACRKTYKINLGKVPYIIPTLTELGWAFDVICPICGEKKNITDYSAW